MRGVFARLYHDEFSLVIAKRIFSIHRAVATSMVFGCAIVSWPECTAADENQPATRDAALAKARLATWKREGWGLMQTYCIDCHNEEFAEAGLDLSPFESLDNLSASEIKRVVEMVEFGAMPPEDYDLPETEERKQLVAALEQTMFSATCDLRPKAGKVTARRLNRNEYDNSIRDLFGLDLNPSRNFPSDEVGAGFDNNGDVLSLSPILIEKYLDAAESVSQRVLIDPASLPRLDLDVPGDQLTVYGDVKIGRFSGRFVRPGTFAWLDVNAPVAGDYSATVRGGASEKVEEPISVAVCDESGLLLKVLKFDYYGGGGRAESERLTVELDKGSQRIFFFPIKDSDDSLQEEYVPGKTQLTELLAMDPDQARKIIAQRGEFVEPTRFDSDEFWFMFRSIQLDGPRKQPRDSFPPKQFELVRQVAPSKRGRYRDVEKYAARNLQPLMRRVFRTEVDFDEVKPYAQLVKQATDEGQSFYRGMQIAISAMLVSPRFLFRVETPPQDARANEFGDLPLSQQQIATRLSYFIWSSTPDDRLLDLADRNQLRGETLRQEIERMIRDPRADALAENFASQWLGLRNLDSHEADETRFPGFDDELKESMVKETELLFLHILRKNLSVREFLIADYSFINRRLAEHYGFTVSHEGFQRVNLSGQPRRGLLSHASILTLTSMPTRTSPVLRGKWILENILGTKAPDPPAGVPELEEEAIADANASFRQQLELHRESASCASCHRVMDQLGFGLDDFDAIGKYRTEDGGFAIDSSGALPDGRSFNGGIELSEVLGKTELDAFGETLVERLLTFALGRELNPDDRCTIDEIVGKTGANGYQLSDILSEIVLSRQFLFQTHAGNDALASHSIEAPR
ncbi:MAG: DUF1592 domain-containing protein [Planctomycetota bacterium]